MPRAFIAMPFAKSLYSVYKVIKEVCEELKITCIRIDEVWAREDIYKQIEEEILKADFVISDFTGDRVMEISNPNVVHETTFASVHKKYLILLAQDHKCLPFDWRTRPAVIYQQTDEGLSYLKERLLTAIRALMQKEDFGKDPSKGDNPSQMSYNMGISNPANVNYAQNLFNSSGINPVYPVPNFMNAGMQVYQQTINTSAPGAFPIHKMENLVRCREKKNMPEGEIPTPNLPEGFRQEKEFIVCEKDESLMVWISKTQFAMGAEEEEDQSPIHDVYLSDYLMDVYPVTNENYNKFIQAGGYAQQEYWTPQGWNWRCKNNIQEPAFWKDSSLNRPRQSVVGISWYESMAYAVWAEKHLPTEAQWECSARGNDQRKYPWGNTKPTKKMANYRTNRTKETGTLMDYDQFPGSASPHGCYNMAGNVWEWCYDWYKEDYYALSSAYNPAGPKDGKEKVCRGGAWTYDGDTLKTYYRFYGSLTLRDKGFGFRCSRIL